MHILFIGLGMVAFVSVAVVVEMARAGMAAPLWVRVAALACVLGAVVCLSACGGGELEEEEAPGASTEPVRCADNPAVCR